MTAAALVAGGVAFAGATLSTRLIEPLARRWGLLDAPDAARRTHAVPTPRLGGIGIVLGVAIAIPFALSMGLGGRAPPGWLLGGLGFFVVGLADDLAPRGRGLPVRWKALALTAVAVATVALGARFDGTAFGPWPAIELGGASVVMTVLWFLAVANVVNFMDGIDAIAGTIAVVLLAAATGTAAEEVAPLYASGAGAVAGFLLWNAPPARIFMGDGGAYVLGFLLAAAGCRFEGPGGAPSGALPWPLLGAGLVAAIVDVGLALLHKARHGIPMSTPHHDHLYQRLTRAGQAPARVALRYGGLTLAAVVIAGPLAGRVGAPAAAAIGGLVLGLHLWFGRLAARAVPRLRAAERPS